MKVDYNHLSVPTKSGPVLVKMFCPDPTRPWLVYFEDLPEKVAAEHEVVEVPVKFLLRKDGPRPAE